jgi:hypothetical protein
MKPRNVFAIQLRENGNLFHDIIHIILRIIEINDLYGYRFASLLVVSIMSSHSDRKPTP